jgi:hypothetical protein
MQPCRKKPSAMRREEETGKYRFRLAQLAEQLSIKATLKQGLLKIGHSELIRYCASYTKDARRGPP